LVRDHLFQFSELNYFFSKLLGDTPKTENCGNCDVCRDPPKTFDATSEARLALTSIFVTGQKFGVSYLIRVIMGDEDKKITKEEHHTLEGVFGAGREIRNSGVWGPGRWRSLFRQLVAAGYVHVDPMFGGLKLDPTWWDFMKGGIRFRFREDREREQGGEGGGESGGLPETPEMPGTTENIYGLLRNLRNEIAREEGIPIYRVFVNETLQELAEVRPKNFENLLKVKGISERKAELYGDRVLRVLRPWTGQRREGREREGKE
jgi:ATP-dependent DNA helicase RecQ